MAAKRDTWLSRSILAGALGVGIAVDHGLHHGLMRRVRRPVSSNRRHGSGPLAGAGAIDSSDLVEGVRRTVNDAIETDNRASEARDAPGTTPAELTRRRAERAKRRERRRRLQAQR